MEMSDTRERLLKAGLRLFTAKGYAKTSIADLEREAGLTPRAGGFYRHFTSKAELAVEIGEHSVIETRRDLGFDGVLPLGDTTAELVLIAKGYRQAHERRAPLARLVAELQGLPQIQALQDRVDRDLSEALMGWLAAKRHVEGMDEARRMALLISILGGWIFYLNKRGSAAAPDNLDDEVMLAQWSSQWARILDGPPPG